jgi:ribonuclease D
MQKTKVKWNPYVDYADLLKWKPTPAMTYYDPTVRFNDVLKYEVVDSNSSYWIMHYHLQRQNMLGVDMERSMHSHLNIISLIQISSTSRNYLIDIFAIPNECCVNLRKILEDTSILKVVIDLKNDFMALQQDFKINMFPVVDLQYANYIVERDVEWKQNPTLNMGMVGLAKKYLQATIGKSPQLADYTVRPLSALHPDVIAYAVQDSKILLPLWNKILSQVATGSSPTGAILDSIFSKMCEVVSTSCHPKKYYPNAKQDTLQMKKVPTPLINKVPKDCIPELERLHEVRFEVSKRLDVPPTTIISQSTLLHSVKTKKVPSVLSSQATVNPTLQCFR